MQIFGWRKTAVIIISFWISYSKSSVIFGSKIFLIATGVPFKNPLWIVLKPPWPIYSPTFTSSRDISLTPGTTGKRPFVTETSLALCVNCEKFYLWISIFNNSISSCSFFEFFFSFFKSFSSSLNLWFELAAVDGLSIV